MIKITIDTKAIAAGLQAAQRKVDRCAAIALTQTAKHAQKAVIAEMPRVFDRPTPYALRGTRVKPANYKTGRLEASVEFKDDVSKGTPAEKYLQAEVFGGRRRLKRFEIALQRIGVLPAGMVVVPGKGIKLDAYGNIPARDIVVTLSYLQAFGEQGYNANMSKEKREKLFKGTRTKDGWELFVVRQGMRPARSGKQLHPGIWRRRIIHGFGSSIHPWMLFVSQPMYRPRLDLDRIRDQAVQQHFQDEFNKVFSS